MRKSPSNFAKTVSPFNQSNKALAMFPCLVRNGDGKVFAGIFRYGSENPHPTRIDRLDFCEADNVKFAQVDLVTPHGQNDEAIDLATKAQVIEVDAANSHVKKGDHVWIVNTLVEQRGDVPVILADCRKGDIRFKYPLDKLRVLSP